MDNGQLSMVTRKKGGRPDLGPDDFIPTQQKALSAKTLKGREFLIYYSFPCSFSLPRK